MSRAALAASGIVLAYVVLGLIVLSPDAIYSGDIGVKFVQARALFDSRFTSLDLPYPGTLVDPDREFFPLRAPFVLSVAGTTQAIFSPAAATVQALLAAMSGLRGLIAGSILSGAVILLASMRLLAPEHRLTAAVTLGLGSPLWFYSISGWEHAPAVALSTTAFAVALATGRRWSGAASGLLVGLAALLREETMLLTPGLLLVIALRTRSLLQVSVALVAAGMPVAASAFLEAAWFGRPAAAHLRHAVHVLENAGDAGVVPALEPLTLRQRYETVLQYWLLGYGADRWIIAFAATLLASLVIRWRWRSRLASIPLLVWILAVVALAATDAWEVVTAPKWLAGLQRVAPYLVFAVLPRPAGAPGGGLQSAVLLACAVYLAAAFAGVDTTGGKSLGPRLLLPLLPLLAAAAIARIHSYARAPARVERAIGFAGAALVATAVVIHVCGTIPAYVGRNRIDGSSISAVRTAPARVVVADDEFTAQLLFPLYYRKIILLADTPELGARLGARLSDEKVSDVLVVSRKARPATELSPLNLRRLSRVGRMVIQEWGR